MSKRNIVWVLDRSGSEYATAQALLATKDIDLLILSREALGPLSIQTIEKAIEQFGAPDLLIVGATYAVERDLVLELLKNAPEQWSETSIEKEQSKELICLLVQHFKNTAIKTKIELNKSKKMMEINGQKIKLTSREFAILDHLLIAPEHIVARADFFNSVWDGLKVCNKVLDVHVSNLRKKVQPYGIQIRFVRSGSFEIILPEHVSGTGKHPPSFGPASSYVPANFKSSTNPLAKKTKFPTT